MTSESTGPSRRDFLGAAASAAVLAANAQAGADVEPVRILVVGTGGRGSDLIRSLTTIDGAEVVGVCDDYEPHLNQGSKYAGPKAERFTDYRQALDRLKPRAVVVAVPLSLHFRSRETPSTPAATSSVRRRCATGSTRHERSPGRWPRQGGSSRSAFSGGRTRSISRRRRW